jgi:hypothetical protein
VSYSQQAVLRVHAESIILSGPPAESMIVTGCAESIIVSASGTESVMLSARIESIILSAGGAESMMLSTWHPYSSCCPYCRHYALLNDRSGCLSLLFAHPLLWNHQLSSLS